MALIACPECESEISSEAAACPKCGHPVRSAPPSGYEAKQPPLEVRPVGVLVGLILLGGGLYLSLAFIPSHDPANVEIPTDFVGLASAITSDKWYLREELVGPMTVAAWGVVVFGVLQLLTGSTKKRGRLGYCKECRLQVVAVRRFIGWKCERCGSRVRE